MKRQRISVTFRDRLDARIVGKVFFGQNYSAAMRATGKSPGQVAYRLRLARILYGLPKGKGLAWQWRNDEGGLAAKVLGKMLPALEVRIMRELSRRRARPTPEIVEALRPRRKARRRTGAPDPLLNAA